MGRSDTARQESAHGYPVKAVWHWTKAKPLFSSMSGARLRKREFFFAFLHDRSPQAHGLPLLYGLKSTHSVSDRVGTHAASRMAWPITLPERGTHPYSRNPPELSLRRMRFLAGNQSCQKRETFLSWSQLPKLSPR